MQHRSMTIDVAGVAVEVEADDDRYEKCLLTRLGDTPSDQSPVVRVVIGGRERAPDRPPDQQMEGYQAWENDGVIWIGQGDAVVRVGADTVEVGGPIDTLQQEDLLDDLLQFGLAAVLTSDGRMVIHGAVVARGDEALVLVGASGKGKSTLAAAALLGDWDLLGDDLAIANPIEATIQAVRRTPMVPGDLAAAHGLQGELAAGSRQRLQLPVEALAHGPRRLIGVVAVDHGIDGGIEPTAGAHLDTLDDALAVPPFRSIIRRYLAPGAALVALPTVILRHARDPHERVARALTSLDEALAHCRQASRT